MIKRKKYPHQILSKGSDAFETLYGVHAVKEALSAGRRTFDRLFISRDSRSAQVNDILNIANMLEIPVETIASSGMDTLTQNVIHQGIAAKASPFPVDTTDHFFQSYLKEKPVPFLLVLDSIVDPQNLGALIRTSVCAGVDGIIIPKDRSAKPTPAVSKASAGAMEHAVIVMATNIANTLNDLKELGIWITGLDVGADKPLYKTDLTGPMAIVVGGEEKGLRPLVKKQCDFIVSIPQKSVINSLNASVAGAVVMYEAFRQRDKEK